ncbi:hypothetical protein [Natrinema gelatinilyticum]|uniref:hypothetical protein n=1 Tax=Natrinema gelatinilyticum TaxID=2961571 RepID=UPI0030F4352C
MTYPYALTAKSAVAAAERVLKRGDRIPVGFQTPSSAFGIEFALERPGIEREPTATPTDSDERSRTTVEVDD